MVPEAIDSDVPPVETNGATGTVQPGASAEGQASAPVTESPGAAIADVNLTGVTAQAPSESVKVSDEATPPPPPPAPVKASIAGVETQADAVNVLLGRGAVVDNSDKIASIQAKIDELSRELEGLKGTTESTLEKEEAAKLALKATLSPAEPVRLFATGVEGKVLAVYFDYNNDRQVSILLVNAAA